MVINIQQPIWNTRSVGLNLDDLAPTEDVYIRIRYKNKSNQYVYPKVFRNTVLELTMAATKIERKKQATLYIVPISKLRETGEEQED